ncbi:phosphoenolpyruvate carboxykinase (GTP) [Caldiplasma sukawensis]
MLGLCEQGSDDRAMKMVEEAVEKSEFFQKLKDLNPELSDKMFGAVLEYANLCNPSKINVIEGDEEESIIRELVNEGKLITLNQNEFPGCYLYRSSPHDVARSEKDTYTCTRGSKKDAGPTNNWIHSDEALEISKRTMKESMKGKTLYVVPYWLGPLNSEYGQGGLELTDSLYVVLNLIKITRVGYKIASSIAKEGRFVLGLHSTVNLDPENRYIFHFPDENEGMGLIISFNTNYGGNALLSKKCHALRIASFRALEEKWLAEHMMAVGVKDPAGQITYITGAFPSSSGKTNLAMLQPPKELLDLGWDTSLISDDITWMHPKNGRLMGINPEYGFFGVAPHTSRKTNPRAMDAISRNTIFTNVAVDSLGRPFWEGMDEKRENLTDWTGKPYNGKEKAAHPNSRFTTPINNYRNLSGEYENPEGVPISAFLFGGRRSDLVPLVMEARDWEEGVLFGAMQRVETTAAAIGKVGQLRHDPMAMKPFMPYNMGKYFDHYLSVGKSLKEQPKIFNVNWFRKDENGEFMWPGYSYNMYVIKWIVGRVNGKVNRYIETPVGNVPYPEDIAPNSLVSEQTLSKLLKIDLKGYLNEFDQIEIFFQSFGNKMPKRMWDIFNRVKKRIESSL